MSGTVVRSHSHLVDAALLTLSPSLTVLLNGKQCTKGNGNNSEMIINVSICVAMKAVVATVATPMVRHHRHFARRDKNTRVPIAQWTFWPAQHSKPLTAN